MRGADHHMGKRGEGLFEVGRVRKRYCQLAGLEVRVSGEWAGRGILCNRLVVYQVSVKGDEVMRGCLTVILVVEALGGGRGGIDAKYPPIRSKGASRPIGQGAIVKEGQGRGFSSSDMADLKTGRGTEEGLAQVSPNGCQQGSESRIGVWSGTRSVGGGTHSRHRMHTTA